MTLETINSFLSLNNTKLAHIVFILVLIASSFITWKNFPSELDYSNADEGTYYRQARVIKDGGFLGFKNMGELYINEPNNQGRPTPLRMANIYICAWLLSINDSIRTLSYYSLAANILLCIALFFFVKRFWQINIALIVSSIAAFFPLTTGLATRALSDSSNYLFSSLSLFFFIYFLNTKNKKHYWLFISSLIVSILIKETNIMFIPFFAGVLIILKFLDQNSNIKQEDILITALIPIFIVFSLYFIAFGGMDAVSSIVKFTLNPKNVNSTNYFKGYLAGPWYQYFIDYFLFSPIISILFFAFIGNYIFSENKSLTTNILLAFFIYFMICNIILPKNIRYGVYLTFIYILFSSLMLVEVVYKYISQQALQKLAVIGLTTIILGTNIYTFYKFYVIEKIYDPVIFNLVKAEKLIPLPKVQNNDETTKVDTIDLAKKDLLVNIGKITADTMDAPTYGKYINLSLYYYQAHLYDESIKMSKKALELNPKSAVAYNNLCSAYNDLQDWDKAIEAGKKALELDPNFQLAKANLEWAESQKGKK